MPIDGHGWEIHIVRTALQTHPGDGAVRTIGTYQVYHDGTPTGVSGVTAESPGPGQNHKHATKKDPRRILAGRYPLATQGGKEYATYHYRPDEQIKPLMPGILLQNTGVRTGIVIHPGKNVFLSSIGCINPCTSLPDGAEKIDYPGSRGRVIALIGDMKHFLGSAFPAGNGVAIPQAWAVIDGEP